MRGGHGKKIVAAVENIRPAVSSDKLAFSIFDSDDLINEAIEDSFDAGSHCSEPGAYSKEKQSLDAVFGSDHKSLLPFPEERVRIYWSLKLQ